MDKSLDNVINAPTMSYELSLADRQKIWWRVSRTEDSTANDFLYRYDEDAFQSYVVNLVSKLAPQFVRVAYVREERNPVVDPQKTILVVSQQRGFSRDSIGYSWESGKGIAGRAIVEGALQLERNLEDCSHFHPVAGDHSRLRSAIAVPLRRYDSRKRTEVPRDALYAETNVDISDRSIAIIREFSEDLELLYRRRDSLGVDEVTGFYRRFVFDSDVVRAVRKSQQMSAPLGMILFDFNNLKRINDSWGHERGDQYLRNVSDAALACLRRSDRIYRIGGDEIVILLPNTSEDATASVVNKLYECTAPVVADLRSRVRGNHLVNQAIAIGYGEYSALCAGRDKLLSAREFRDCVDTRMYAEKARIKNTGKSKFRLFMKRKFTELADKF